jgi:hypothetical protein
MAKFLTTISLGSLGLMLLVVLPLAIATMGYPLIALALAAYVVCALVWECARHMIRKS